MIELKSDQLHVSFADVHPSARLTVEFQRTLRIPDDGKEYPLPPGLGRFPVRHVDDYAARVPARWLRHGGVVLPMYQSEALWLSFNCARDAQRGVGYPFAIKVAAGMRSAVTGDAWHDALTFDKQDHLVVPLQPWLDGFCVGPGTIRQFVAMPLGAGYSAEEQLTGQAAHGGLQVIVYPMKRAAFEARFPARTRELIYDMHMSSPRSLAEPDMGLAPGGKMRQEIYEDPYRPDEWDTTRASRCFVHLANSLTWQSITGGPPPAPPLTADAYTRAGLPWFDYYDERAHLLGGAGQLANLKSVREMGAQKGDVPLPENESVTPERVIAYRTHLAPGVVREGLPQGSGW